jgi:hypothetical protein
MRLQTAFLGVMLLSGCGEPDGTSTCPNDLPASCPVGVPSYAADIAPVIHDRCAPCHSPGGSAGDRPLTSYAEVYARRGPVLNQTHACRMPPSGATAPTPDERAALLGWLVCGAPNN